MRLAAAVLLGAAMIACTTQNAQAPTPTPTSPAKSQAADMRTQLDLLLSEQVMIIAKESAAAVNHSDEYAAYTSLLATNSADLTNLIGRAFGNTAAVEFAQVWNSQDGYLVDYAIGVVTHNDDKANSAMTSLTGTFTPHFATLVNNLSRLALDPLTQLARQQVLYDKAFIDDVSAANYKTYYADLHRAYAQTSRLGDALARQIAADFPDKFPGDPAAAVVNARVAIDEVLQEHSYLATMATDATLSARTAERIEALGALSTNADAMRSAFEDPRFTLAWNQESAAIETYAANHDAASRQELTGAFVALLASITKAPSGVIANHVDATIKVIDDQRSKAKTVADDDRAAATSMQPIADSVV